jgi:hypothetical protein
MAVTRGAAFFLLLVMAAGCRRETPIERFGREFRERQQSRFALAQLETLRIRGLSDNNLVRMHQKDGLGLAIRPEKTELRVGEPLKLHVAYENLSAKGPIAATTCQGFEMSDTDEATGAVTIEGMNFDCSLKDVEHDNQMELPQGVLKTGEVTTADMRLRFDHPGRHIVMASWQSFRPQDEVILRGEGYSLVGSNQLLIIVK